MSYEMPIKLALQMERIMVQAREEQDKKIYQAVLDSGINVSRDELIKALKYDRDQYVKGYEDGKADAMQWIPCSERLPEECTVVLVSLEEDEDYEWIRLVREGYYDEGYWFDTDGSHYGLEVLAWMPLPEPYKLDQTAWCNTTPDYSKWYNTTPAEVDNE